MKFSILLSALLNSWLIFADGPPIDSSGNILVPYFTVELTEIQKSQLENSRRVQLTETQQGILKNVWPYDEVEVLDPHYDDCTCGMYYAIWLNPNEIAFLGDSTVSEALDAEMIEEQFEMYSELYSEDRNNSIYIGINGDVSYNSEIIPSAKLKGVLEGIQQRDKDKQYVIIYVAPEQGNDKWEKVLTAKELVKKSLPEKLYAAWM